MEKMPPLIAPTAVPWNTLLFVFMAIKAPIMAPISAPTIQTGILWFLAIQKAQSIQLLPQFFYMYMYNTLKMTFSKIKL